MIFLVVLMAFLQTGDPPVKVSPAEKFIPQEAAAVLTARFRSWEIASPDDETASYYATKQDLHPSVTKGDYDGDGSTDYAVFLSRKGNPSDRIVVALLARGNSFEATYAGKGFGYLLTLPKGTRDFDYETRAYFRYRNDAILNAILDKAGWSLVYSKGRFVQLVTSD